MEKMKSIRDIADELGVSKTAVNKKIKKLGIKSKLKKNGNQFAIDNHYETLIKAEFYVKTANQKSQTANQSANRAESLINTGDLNTNANQETQTVCDTGLRFENEQKDKIISILESENRFLKEQLQAKDEIIKREQELRLISEKKFLLLSSVDEKNTEENVSVDTVDEINKWWQFWK